MGLMKMVMDTANLFWVCNEPKYDIMDTILFNLG